MARQPLNLNKYSFKDDRVYQPIYGNEKYLISREGIAYYNDGILAYKLKVAKNGTIAIPSNKGGYYRPVVRNLVAHHFLGTAPKGTKVSSRDGNKLNAHINNIHYKPSIVRNVYKKKKAWCGAIIYMGVKYHMITTTNKDSAIKKVNETIDMIERYNEWEPEIFRGDVRSFASIPY